MATEAPTSAIPNGMRQVTKAQFWYAVMHTNLNVHPFPERNETFWNVVGTRHCWGWSSYGFGNQKDDCEIVYALTPSATTEDSSVVRGDEVAA